MNYYAHSLEGQKEEKWQILKDHLISVANLASKFAEKFKAADLGYLCGLLHDIGKYTKEFQEKLKGKKNIANHSIAGAKEAIKKYGNLWGKIIAYIIAGHHAGLADFIGTGDDSCLNHRLQNEQIYDYSFYIYELNGLVKDSLSFPKLNVSDKKETDFSCYVLIKILFSCLVDADYLDTERFCEPERYKKRLNDYSLKELNEKLKNYLEKLKQNKEKTKLNEERDKILENCLNKAEKQPGFFTLTVPTGGGKTLSSLAFAMKHAIKNKMERIIYVIPYTSIIEQNADVFRDIFGNEFVLEHHSNFEYEAKDNDEDDLEYKLKLASENWDIPIVATTNVQFFESLFSNRSSSCRKLHNIIKSVIILDEAQMLPVEYMKPCLYMLAELIKNYGCSVVFCTATQPAIFENPPENFKIPNGINPNEIIQNPKELYTKLKAVNINWLGDKNINELTEKLLEFNKVLCIVNTRRLARELYENIKQRTKDGIYHLSAAMCPVHRSEKIAEIKESLKNSKKCIVVSTQLIEAGVDIDFPVVFREIAGIDSIAQAAGRCNRERKIKKGGDVYVFKMTDYKIPSGFLSRTAGVAKEVINTNEDGDLLGLENIKRYFEILYSREGEGLDGKNILQSILDSRGKLEYPFKTIAENFKIIDDITYSIIVPYDKKCEQILEKIKFSPYPASYIRDLQRYTVQVYKQDFDKLLENKKIENLKGIFFVLKKEEYLEDIGLKIDNDENKLENYII
ncbi:MAG: CRISPR-associated helicase Cas3' [Candidatus Goldbacteria bacterium]|nr:CRISPR-associated helicase Cas3' [Candidatus Goldiibacteriota bacterium]